MFFLTFLFIVNDSIGTADYFTLPHITLFCKATKTPFFTQNFNFCGFKKLQRIADFI